MGSLLHTYTSAMEAPWTIVAFSLLYAFLMILNTVMLFLKLKSEGYKRPGQGIKEIRHSIPAHKISIKEIIFGSRRSVKDDVTWGSIYYSFYRFIRCYSIVIFTRGTKSVVLPLKFGILLEVNLASFLTTSYGHLLMQAITRNTTLIFLLSALIRQSILLTYNFFTGGVSVQSYLSKAAYPPFNLSEVSLLFLVIFCDFCLYLGWLTIMTGQLLLCFGL